MVRNPQCKACVLNGSARTVCLWGHGPANAAIMLVGEAPGEQEDQLGRPFVGRAGELLNRLLTDARLDRKEIYISNVCKCRPPVNRTPLQEEISACLPYLISEIEAVQPRVIVCLGGTSLQALTGKKGITSQRGKIFPPRRGLYIDAQIIGTIHPAACLRPGGDRYVPQIVEDLKMAKQIAFPKARTDEVHLVLPEITPPEALLALQRLESSSIVAVDAEWCSLAKGEMVWPWSKRGTGFYSLALTGREQGGANDGGMISVALAWPPSEQILSTLQHLLDHIPAIFHNATADLLWLYALKLRTILGGDTMLLQHLMDERQAKSLQSVATRYSEEVDPSWKGHLRSTRPISHDEWRELLKYNSDDTRATLLAWEGLLQAIRELPADRRRQISRLHSKLLIPALPVLVRAATVGVPIDVAALRNEAQKSRARQGVAIEALAADAGVTNVQAAKLASSTQQTQEYLRGPLGLSVWDSRKDSLVDLIEHAPTVQHILMFRREQKLRSTYFEPWLDMLDRQGDGRLHTIYRPTGTRTGRLSAETEQGGSLHVAPRDTPDVSFRKMIRAPEGHVILAADYSQIELRVVAWLSQDPNMLRFYQEGRDLHTATAAYFLACRYGPMPIEQFWPDREQWMAKVTKPERQAAKGGNFGMVYGMAPPKLRDYARLNYGVKLTLQEAEEMHAGYFRLYGALPAWHAKALLEAEEFGYTETPFGRRRQFTSGDVHAAINTPVQSTASDFGLLAMAAVAKCYRQEELHAVIIGTIHDSILVESTEYDAKRAGEILIREMENIDTAPFGFTVPVPLVAELKVGQTWG